MTLGQYRLLPHLRHRQQKRNNMSKSALSITTALFLLCMFVGPARAVEDTDPAPSSDPVTETLKERVQKVLSAESTNTEGSLNQIGSFAFVGTLEKIVGSTVQLSTVANESKVCELDKSTKIFRQNKAIGREEIELNSPVVVIGIKDSDGVLRVQTLRIVDESIYPSKRQTILGTFQTLTTKSLTVSLLGMNAGGSVGYPVTTKTAFLDNLGGKLDKKTFVNGQKILVVLPQTQTATASAMRVFSLVANPTGL